ncbi:MAG: DUF427 domain-containing protein [Gammaproteobacteria bacterium]|nr:DUF427 domain-containing protein [Gammaproteobacteria bacterium]
MTGFYCIKLVKNDAVIARAPSEQIISLEGHWYFPPECVDTTRLISSDRLYTCPEKGTSFWVDLHMDKLYFNDIAWVYPAETTKPDYQYIANYYGFFPEHQLYYYEKCN